MPYSISISEPKPDQATTWEKQLTKEEYEQVSKYCLSRKVVPIQIGVLIPARTNTGKNFAKDFFLPALINHALKINNIAGKVFAIIASVFLDLLTLPIRLLTCIPKIIANAVQKEHPLRKYLKQEGVKGKLMESDYVHVRLTWEGIEPEPKKKKKDKKDPPKPDNRLKQFYQEQYINFVNVPPYKEAELITKGKSGVIDKTT